MALEKTAGRAGGRTAVWSVCLNVCLSIVLAVCPSARLTAQCPDGALPPCGLRPSAPPRLSVAVLYFQSLSRDSSDVLLADGFTEELSSSLGKVESLVVRSRGMVQRFRGQPGTDPITVGRALNAAYVVSGTLRHSNDRLRVTVELARSSTGAQAWADVFERSSTDLMGIESDLARAVATAIAGRLRPQDQAALTRRPTSVPVAFTSYITGNALMARRESGGLPGALAAYRAAVQLDPSFAAAWARLAEALELSSYYMPASPEQERRRETEADSAANRAMALDSTSAEAWMARGMGLSRARPMLPGQTLAAFERAVATDSTIAETQYMLGNSLRLFSADLRGAERHLRRAHALDPSLTNAVRWLATVCWVQGRAFEARAWFDTLRAMAPELARGAQWINSYGDVLLRTGDTSGARAELREFMSRPTGGVAGEQDSVLAAPIIARLLAQLGDAAGSRARLGDVGEMSFGDHPDRAVRFRVTRAAALVALGDHAAALEELDTAERMRDQRLQLWTELRAPYFAPLLGEPRFARLLESLWPR